MGIVGVMVNCALIGQSGQVHRMFPNITGTQTILLIIILEVHKKSLEKTLAIIIFQEVSWQTARVKWQRRKFMICFKTIMEKRVMQH